MLQIGQVTAVPSGACVSTSNPQTTHRSDRGWAGPGGFAGRSGGLSDPASLPAPPPFSRIPAAGFALESRPLDRMRPVPAMNRQPHLGQRIFFFRCCGPSARGAPQSGQGVGSRMNRPILRRGALEGRVSGTRYRRGFNRPPALRMIVASYSTPRSGENPDTWTRTSPELSYCRTRPDSTSRWTVALP